IPQVLAAFDPGIEWVDRDDPALPHHGTHRGPGAVASGVFGMVVTHFEQFAVTPLRIHDAGEHRSLGVSVRSWTARRDLHHLNSGVEVARSPLSAPITCSASVPARGGSRGVSLSLGASP